MRKMFAALACLIVIAPNPVRAADDRDLELRDRDRVVFVGDGFFERELPHSYLETMLTIRWPDRNITFRNLGWNGDTVFGEARGGFGSPADGFRRLVDDVVALKPTVIFVAYGMTESFEGDAGLLKFERGMRTLLDKFAETKARLVLLSPIRHENLGPPLPSPANHNLSLERYCEAIEKIAAERRALFVNLFDLLGDGTMDLDPPVPRTHNGIYLTATGYWYAAGIVERNTGFLSRPWRIEFDAKGTLESKAIEIENVQKQPNRIRFEAVAETLPEPLGPPGPSKGETLYNYHLMIHGLPKGDYVVKIDGTPALRFQHACDDPTKKPDPVRCRISVETGPEFEQAEQLRRAIVTKNRLYFHRWRPQNETYLFGFRKHEQGQNAAEVPKFDPLVEEWEATIAKLRVPTMHTYEIVKQEQ
jgi:hypothetical protein